LEHTFFAPQSKKHHSCNYSTITTQATASGVNLLAQAQINTVRQYRYLGLATPGETAVHMVPRPSVTVSSFRCPLLLLLERARTRALHNLKKKPQDQKKTNKVVTTPSKSPSKVCKLSTQPQQMVSFASIRPKGKQRKILHAGLPT
jgi:hypothetical protein